MKPTVAILLANYNHAGFLPQALEGIRDQTRVADEVIIVDDGSTDNSLEIIAAYSADLPNLRLIKNERNLGVQYSIAKALEHTCCDYIVWTAADDWLLPAFLEKSMAVLERYPHSGLCFSELSVLMGDPPAVVHFARNPSIFNGYPEVAATFTLNDLPEYLSPQDYRLRVARGYLSISGNTVVARREFVLKAGGFVKSLEWHADWFTYCTIVLRHGACIVNESLAVMRAKPDSYSSVGMHVPSRQQAVLHAIVDALKSPENRDILPAFYRYPALLSVFGAPMRKALLTSRRDWDLYLCYSLWLHDAERTRRQIGWLHYLVSWVLRMIRKIVWSMMRAIAPEPVKKAYRKLRRRVATS